MSIISAIKSYLIAYSGLKTYRPLWVDYLGSDPTQYAIIPLAGSKILEAYVDGGSSRSFPFAFQSMESTAGELERLENNGFFEAFADWLENRTTAKIFPILATGKTPTEIGATGWAYLYEQGQSATGVYQVQCRLVYEQAP